MTITSGGSNVDEVLEVIDGRSVVRKVAVELLLIGTIVLP